MININKKNSRNLELNLTDDNNFYVSRTITEDIRFRLQSRSTSVTNDEIQLLKRVESREHACIEHNIHYFVVPDPTESGDSAYCHWCDMTVVEYAQNQRIMNKKV